MGEAVIYQIFPDRFRRSGRVKEQRNLHLKPWGSDPSLQGFQGGDLYGVIDALDHIQSMGVTCLYLTPTSVQQAITDITPLTTFKLIHSWVAIPPSTR